MSLDPAIGRAQDAEAAALLYERHSQRLLGYCLYHLRSREEVEDAVQETFLHAFRALQRGVVPDIETAWLFKIAANVCLTRRRSGRRREQVETPRDLQALQDVVPARERDGDDLMQLDAALAGMPERERRAILLREWQGLSYREIAEELDLSQGAVESLIFRARRSLAEGLNAEARPRRRLARAFDVGSLLAGLKSALGGASLVKLAAAVAALATAAVATGAVAQRVARPAEAEGSRADRRAASPAAVRQESERTLHTRLARRSREGRDARARQRPAAATTGSADADARPASEVGPTEGDPLAVKQDGAEASSSEQNQPEAVQTKDALGAVDEVADGVEDAVEDVVEEVVSTLPKLETPSLPTAPLPEVPPLPPPPPLPGAPALPSAPVSLP